MNNIIDMKSYKQYYIIYREYGQAVAIECDFDDFIAAHDKAFAWAAEKTNRMATVFSFTKNNYNPQEEFVANNQFVDHTKQVNSHYLQA